MDELTNAFDNLTLFPSSKKKKDGSTSWLLVDDLGYEYKVGYEAVSGLITWRCNNTNFPNCPGKVTTVGRKKPITVKCEHEHGTTIKTKVNYGYELWLQVTRTQNREKLFWNVEKV